MRLMRILIFWVLCGASIYASDPIAEAPTQTIQLFNQKDLSGFHTWLVDTKREDPRRVFSVSDGVLKISGDGFGYLATEKAYRNYHLVAEFKWGSKNLRGREGKARDSGIFLHASGPDGNSFDGNGAFMCAIECQVMEGSTGDFLLIKGRQADKSVIPIRVSVEAQKKRDADGWPTWKSGGSLVKLENGGRVNWFDKDPAWQDMLDFRGKNDIEQKVGEWNRIECVCDGNEIRVILNGTVVNEIQAVSPAGGRILLQCEGSEIYFRKLELQPIQKRE